MEALLRDTLEWVKVNPKDQFNGNKLRVFGDNFSYEATPEKILAVKGNLFTKKYGYCSNCGKVMTKKEFEKHISTKIKTNECANCSYCKVKNRRIVNHNGELLLKGDIYCSYGYQNEKITKDSYCPKNSCCNATFIENPKVFVRLPKEIITIKQFVDNEKWDLVRKDSNYIRFRHIRYNIEATFDLNGYLMFFSYNGNKCYFNGESLRDYYGRPASSSERINSIIRRFYS